MKSARTQCAPSSPTTHRSHPGTAHPGTAPSPSQYGRHSPSWSGYNSTHSELVSQQPTHPYAVVILAIAASRVGRTVHFVSDVVAGIVLGLAFVLASAAAPTAWRHDGGSRPAYHQARTSPFGPRRRWGHEEGVNAVALTYPRTRGLESRPSDERAVGGARRSILLSASRPVARPFACTTKPLSADCGCAEHGEPDAARRCRPPFCRPHAEWLRA